MIPPLEELLATSRVVELPLRAPFRSIVSRQVLLFTGPNGAAEWAPFKDHGDAHSARWLLGAIEQAYGKWPQPLRDAIPVNAILPDLPPTESAEWAAEQFAAGITTFKLKVGGDARTDAARVAEVRNAVGKAQLRIDANGRWTLDEALVVLPRLAAAAGELEYVEQPCASLRECAAVRQKTGQRVAVDEGVRLVGDPSAVIDALVSAADVLILKAIPLGGVKPALDVAEAAGLPVVVSGSLDTSVGLASGLALAAALPQLPYACGLGTGALFAADVVEQPALPAAGWLQVGRREPSDELVEQWQAAPEVVAEWRERLSRCHALLADAGKESL